MPAGLDFDIAAPDGAGGTIAALRQGDGEDVVMIHGAYTNARDWRASGLIERIAAAGYRVTAPDRPDQGASRSAGDPPVSPAEQAARLDAAVGEMGVENPILIAHSLGAAVALAWALRAPQRIRAMLLIAGATHPWGGGDESWHNRLACTPVVGPVFVHGLVGTLGRATILNAVASGFAPDAPPTDYAAQAAAADGVRPAAYRATARTLLSLDADLRRQAKAYGAIRAPTLAITGDPDTVVSPFIHSRALGFDLQNARTVVAAGHGHNLHHVRQDLVLTHFQELAAETAIARDRSDR